MRRNPFLERDRDEAVAGFGEAAMPNVPAREAVESIYLAPPRGRNSLPSNSYGGRHLRSGLGYQGPAPRRRPSGASAVTPMSGEAGAAFAPAAAAEAGGELRRRRGTQRMVEADEELEDGAAFFIPPEGRARRGVLEGFLRSAAEDDELLDERDVAFVRQSEIDLERANERLRERLKEMRRIAIEFRERKRGAEASSRTFQRKYEELQREREELEQRLKSSEAAANRLLTRSKEAEERRRQIERQQRRLGYEDADAEEAEPEAVDANLPAWRRALERGRLLLRRVKRWWFLHAPLLEDVRYIEARYGQGLGVYFSFFRFIVYSSSALALLWLALQAAHWADLARGDLGPGATALSSFVPVWALYSSFPAKEGVLYAATVFLTAAVVVAAAFARQVRESRFKRASDLHEASSQNFKVARVGLSLLEVSSDTVGEFDNARQATAEHFRLVLNNSQLEARIAARTREERTRLFARKVVGSLLVGVLILLGSGLVLLLTIFNTRITASLAASSLPSGVASFVTPVVVNIVNAIVPFLIVQITKYEQWDRHETRVKMLLIRLFTVKAFNIVVQVLTYFDVRSGKYVVSSQAETEAGAAPRRAPPRPATPRRAPPRPPPRPTRWQGSSGVFCPEDFVGQKLFVNVLSDYFVNRAFFAAVVWKDLHFTRARAAFFDLPNQITDLLITASIFWVAVPYFPYLALLEAPLLYAAFKFEKFMLLRYMSKPATPWSASDTGVFLVWLTDASAAMSVACFYYFLSQAGRTNCGPFFAVSAYDELYAWLAERSVFFEVVLAVLTHPLFVWGLAVLFAIRALVLKDSIEVVQLDWEDKQYQLAKQVSLLSATIRRLRTELDFHRKQAQGLAEEAGALASDEDEEESALGEDGKPEPAATIAT
eukprot:tig00000498_g1649.t1